MLGTLTDLVEKVIPMDTPISRESTEYATRWVINDDSKLRNETGIRYRPLQETVSDTVQWLCREGLVNQKWTQHIRPLG